MAPLRRHALVLARSGLVRQAPDPTYADGDDASWMGVDWAAMTRQVEIDGRSVNLVDTGGPRPPMLFIHGLGGSWQNWLLNIPVFTGDFRCVALDLPGFGESDMPAEPISIQGYARVVDGVCAALGVRSPIVVGNSMGGFIGAEMALAHPARVRRLVLVSAAGLSTEYQRREPLLTLARLWAATTARTAAHRDLVVRRKRLRRVFLQTVIRYPEKLSAPLTAELVKGAGKEGFLPALAALLGYSFRDRLAEIEVPVLIVWGRDDVLVPVSDAALYERLIGSNARRVVFDGTGHAPMLERPSRFNALLREFTRGAPVPEAGVEGVHAR